MREIKFRAYYKPLNKMINNVPIGVINIFDEFTDGAIPTKDCELMQFTGLSDKNGLQEVYEYDIIDREGNLIGNLYENEKIYKEGTHLLIQDFGGKTWCATYNEAMERGLKHS